MIANLPTMDSLEKRYGVFSGSWMSAEKVKVLLVVSGFDVHRDVEAQLINKYVNIKEGNMGGEDGLGKLDRVATIESLKEKEKGIMTMSP